MMVYEAEKFYHCLRQFVSGGWALSISIFVSSRCILFFKMSRTFVVFQSSFGDSWMPSIWMQFQQV